ncbi:hypothetical protein [Geothrix sp. SG200]|uniref:hypothetical protein n=1 Tax=Geothrix sp. SG200 TaxID=2922865 RepID=UPI001FAC573C|nr:hypothetical protein [Geothrix sp. SG200]
MHEQSQIDILLSAAIKSWGGVITALGFFATTISLFIIPKETKYEARWVIVIFMIFAYLCLVLLRAFIDSYNYSNNFLPKIKIARKPLGAYQTTHALLLLNPTPLLTYDSLVSIYILESELERLVGIGRVINIQLDKKIQIAVISDVDFGDRWKALYENRSDDLSKLIIKPSVPNYIIEGAVNV